MAKLEDLPREDNPLTQPQGWTGEVSKGATEPDELVAVTIGALDGQEWNRCRWMPLAVSVADVVSLAFPERGDRCLVVFDEDDDAHVVLWWPA